MLTPVSLERSSRTVAIPTTAWPLHRSKHAARLSRPTIDYEPLRSCVGRFGQGKSVLRFQAGVYHAPRVGGGTTGETWSTISRPIEPSASISATSITSQSGGHGFNRPSNINAVEVNSHTPSIYNFTFGLQQDIGFDTIMEVSYVGRSPVTWASESTSTACRMGRAWARTISIR